MRPAEWFDAGLVRKARAACKRSTGEVREHRKDAKGKEKLPVSEDMLVAAKARLWEGKSWGWGDMDLRMTYVGIMWGFEIVARVSEYTSAETSGEDHCVRLWQVSFVLGARNGRPERVVAGGKLAQEFKDDPGCIVLAYEVDASSHKGGR